MEALEPGINVRRKKHSNPESKEKVGKVIAYL
jgi:hypothetical protein